MTIYKIILSIYDEAQSPGFEIPVDYAERKTVKLIYDGSDTRYQPFIASSVELTLEVDAGVVEAVDQETDLFYKNLFTGEENRFLVELTNQDNDLIWRGYLLPDEYGEPYEAGQTFYVNFTATDGLGLLKGHSLGIAFERGRHNVMKVIADCLKKTGHDLDIYIAPGIQNLGAGWRWDHMYIGGAAWGLGGDQDSCYDILQDLIRVMGCTMYQESGRWYIVGINRRSMQEPVFYIYNADGVYQGFTQSVAQDVPLEWDASPEVTLLPPFKKVTVESGVDSVNALLPEDIVDQGWIKEREPQPHPPVRFWQSNDSGISLELKNRQDRPVPAYTGDVFEVAGFVGFQHINALVNQGDVDGKTISLKRKPFVSDTDADVTLRFLFQSKHDNPNEVNQAFSFGDYNDHQFYELTVDGVPLISNKHDFGGRNSYFFTWSEQIINGFSYISLELEITLTGQNVTGYLDFILYNQVQAAVDDHIWMEQLFISVGEQVVADFSLSRDLQRTNKESVSLGAVGDSVLDLLPEAFIYQPEIPEVEFTEIPFTVGSITLSTGQIIKNVLFVTPTDRALLIAFDDRIFLERFGGDFKEYVHDIDFTPVDICVKVNTYDQTDIVQQDRLLVRLGTAGDPQNTVNRGIRERWQKTTREMLDDRLGIALANLMHSNYPEAFSVMEGQVKGLIFPGDLLRFRFDGVMKKWHAVRIEQTIGENESRITIMEDNDQELNDYE